jgi:DNA-binding LacI/PurR family transcriptional regulator
MTTIQQDMERIAASAVKHIRDIAAGSDENRILERVSPVFVVRGSF